MSIGRTKEEQELTSLLANTLVRKEVIEPMEKIGWSHASPPPPDYSDNPKPAEGAPAPVQPQNAQSTGGPPATTTTATDPATTAKADTPAPSATELDKLFEPLRDANGLILGKYKTGIEAFKGAGHLAQMAKQSFQERDAAREALSQLTAGNTTARPSPAASPAAAPRPEPHALVESRSKVAQAQAQYDAVLSHVDEGMPLDKETLMKVNAASRELANAEAEHRMQENAHAQKVASEQENNRWTAVDDYMQANYPDALRLSAEIGVHIAADPVLQEAVSALVAQGKEIKASILAWQSYQRAVSDGTSKVEMAAAQEKEADLAAKEQVRQELLEKARKDAGVIQGAAGGQGIHENVDGARPSREELGNLASQMRMEGEGLGMPGATRFRHLLIGRHLDPAIFGPR